MTNEMPGSSDRSREFTIVSHCTIFYWWPVWVVGFLMSFLTWMSPERMVIVSKDTLSGVATEAVVNGRTYTNRDAWIFPQDVKLDPNQKMLLVAPSKNIGVLFAVLLLVIIAITNIPLRGLWSVIVIGAILLVSVVLALYDAWGPILEALNLLDIRMNLGGYLLISTVLLILWLVALIFFDHQVYMTFSPGVLTVCTEIGDGAQAVGTKDLIVHKQRSDFFRHWVIGLGSGDLIVKAGGQTYEMPNVLFIGPKLRKIQQLMPEVRTV